MQPAPASSMALQVTGEQPSTSQAAGEEEEKDEEEPLSGVQSGLHTFLERSRYIPLRLSADERRYLHLLEAALSVSAYTDKVRRFWALSMSAYPDKVRRI